MMKKNIKVFVLVFLICVSNIILIQFVFAADSTTGYKLLETMPGVGKAGEAPKKFSEYIKLVYNFFVAFVVISALLMITIGGFSYILSAGNQAQAGTAKTIITDALIGLIVVFVSWIILNTINPDLIGSGINLNNLQNNAKDKSKPSDNTKIDKTDTYCYMKKCYDSNSECMGDNNLESDCGPLQNEFDKTKDYIEDENGFWQEASEEECMQAGAHCMSGGNLEADLFNTTKTEDEIKADVAAMGLDISDKNNTDGGPVSVNELPPVTKDALNDVINSTGCAKGAVLDCPDIVGGTEKYGDGADRVDLSGGPLDNADFLGNLMDNAVETDSYTRKDGDKTVNVRSFVYPEGHNLAGQRVDYVYVSGLNEYFTVYSDKVTPPAAKSK